MKMRLTINSIGHLLVDAVCAAALFGPVAESGELGRALLLYNTLAFTTQCAVGLLTDMLPRHERLAGAALAVAAMGLLLPLPPLARVIAVGLGNSVYHVAAGTVTIKDGMGKAAPLGVFVAPGAIGLALGTFYSAAGTYFALAALVLAAAQMLALREGEWQRPKARRVPWLAVAALLAAVAVRAIGAAPVTLSVEESGARTLLAVLSCLRARPPAASSATRGARRSHRLSLPAAPCSRRSAPRARSVARGTAPFEPYHAGNALAALPLDAGLTGARLRSRGLRALAGDASGRADLAHGRGRLGAHGPLLPLRPRGHHICRQEDQGGFAMKKLSAMLLSASLALALAVPALADVAIDPEPTVSAPLIWPWIVLGAAVIAVVVIIFAVRKKKKGANADEKSA